MSTRITPLSTTASMLADLNAGRRALDEVQRQVASGKRLQQVSDSPAEAVTSLDHRARLHRSEQLGRNAEVATRWLNESDRALSTVVDRLNAARTALVQATSGANDATSRLALANQIRALRESLLETANTSIGGRPIFAGTSASPAAFAPDGTYQGDAGAVSLPISAGVTMTVAATGPDVFGTTNPLDPATGDIFQQLDALATAVQNGDTAAIQAGLGQIDAATTRVQTVQVRLGSRSAQLTDLRASAAASDQELTSAISDIEDVDLAEATIRLKSREVAYQASLQVTARVIQLSLMDFLR